MMLPLPLFDPPSKVEEPQRFLEETREARADVVRIIESSGGPFTEVREGKTTGREFRILELSNGQYVSQWNDGTRGPLPGNWGAVFIEDGLRFKTMREVPR